MDKLVINQLPVERLIGKRVFLRVDAGVDQSSPGARFDESKLRATLPTSEYLTSVAADNNRHAPGQPRRESP